MKTLTYSLTCFSLILFLCIPAAAEWRQVGEAVEYSTFIKLCLDDTTPYLALSPLENEVKTFNGSSWEQLGSDFSVSGGAIDHIAITAIDGTPYVAWIESTGIAAQVFVNRLNGSNWEQLGSYLNINSSDNAENVCIAHYNGTPYIAWEEFGDIYVKHFNGSSWVQDGSSLNVNITNPASSPDIAIFDNIPYVVWVESVSNTKQVYVKHYTGSVWVPAGGSLNIDSNQNVSSPSIAFASNGRPYVAWTEHNGVAKQLYVKHFTGTMWEQDGGNLNTSVNQNAESPSIATYNETPYVTWFESNGVTNQVHVKYFTGSDWVFLDDSLNISNTINAVYSDMEIDSSGIPFICFTEGSNHIVKHYIVTPTPTPTATATPGTLIYVNNLLPSYGTQGSSVSATIIGYDFTTLPTVRLIATGKPDITATNVVIKSNELITCQFDLNTAVEGKYNLHLENAGKAGTLVDAFHVLLLNSQHLIWKVTDIDSLPSPIAPGSLTGIAVGNGNNNSLQDIFSTNRNVGFHRLSWQGTSWLSETLPSSPSSENNTDVLICDADNDGVKEVYIAAQDNHIYQYKGADWDKVDLGSGAGSMNALACGDGNNDGRLELYAACSDGFIYQYLFDEFWTGTTIAASSASMQSVAVGDADNDNLFEVYASNIDHSVYEISHVADEWLRSYIGSGSGIMYTLIVADADNNGTNELYGSNEDHKLYQFIKQISDWQSNELGYGNGALYDLSSSDGDCTGRNELYAACGDGHIYQFKYYNNQWETSDLGTAQTPLYALAIGDGNNDNQFEIFSIGENSHIYQFKASSYNPTPTPIPDFGGTIISEKYTYCAPNPIRGDYANIVIYTQHAADISAKLFTTSNQEVLSFRINCPSQGRHEKQLNVANLSNGVYLLLVKATDSQGNTERIVKKLALVQ